VNSAAIKSSTWPCVISQAGVAIDPNKIQALLDWPMPQNIKQLRGFVGIIGYYKRFMALYADF